MIYNPYVFKNVNNTKVVQQKLNNVLVKI